MMAKIKWCILFSVMASCSAPKDTGTLDSCNVVATRTISHNDTLPVCDISKVNQTVTMPLSELADYKLVKLENTTKEMMVSLLSSIYVSDNYVVIVGNERYDQIKLFDKSGKFIRTIERAGNDPGEFIPAVFRVGIEEQQDRIWIADCSFEKLMVYSLSTGQFVHQIPFPHKAIIPSFIANAEDTPYWSPMCLWSNRL